MNAKYYVIESDYVGPNKKDSNGHWIGETRHFMEIRNEPGRKNMSHEPCENGWLGTTNDISMTAHGSYETIEDARTYINENGFTELCDSNDFDTRIVETYLTADAEKEQWDAGDWLDPVTHLMLNHTLVRIEDVITITAASTDDELQAAAEKIEELAREESILLHDTMHNLNHWRDWCIPQDDDK